MITIETNWAAVKNFLDEREIDAQYVDHNGNYYIAAIDGAFSLTTLISQEDSENADLIDFEENYKDAANDRLEAPKDGTGRPIVRGAITLDGWSAQFHAMSFKTSQLDSAYNKKVNGDDLGFMTLKCYDEDDEEIESQETADSEAVKTIIEWQPNHDFEIVGGQLMQAAAPGSNVYLWVIGLPGILNVMFTQGGINLKMCGAGGVVDFDGRASKYLPYNGGAGTNKFRIVLKHGAGVKHELQVVFQIFKS